MANKIQIKRSSTSNTPGSLNAGELAFSNVVGGSGVLFIGSTDGGTVVPVGGVRNPGLLTANQALVANSTSYIDQIKVANLVADQIYANGTFGTSGYVLATSGTSGNAYWVDPTTLATKAGGSNTQVQFNDSEAFGATSDFTFDKDTKTLYIANTVDATTFTGTANNANNLGGVAASAYVNTSGDYSLSGNIEFTSNFYANAQLVIKADGDIVITNGAGIQANGTWGNAGDALLSDGSGNLYYGAPYSANNSSYVGGNTVGDIVTLAVANTQSNDNTFTGNNVFQGTNTAVSSNLTISGTDTFITSNVYITATNTNVNSNFEVHGSQVELNANVYLNGANVYIYGNTTFDGMINSDIIPTSNSFSLGNTTNRWDKIWLNGSTIEIGNSSISDTANGITIPNLQVTANAISANIVGSTTGISSNLVISSSNIEATSAFLRVADVEVSGNLVINGTLTTVNTNNLVVRDNIIKLATGNLTDSLDSGFFVNYNTTQFAGLARDHTDGVFKLFDTSTEPSTTVDFANAATLKAYLKSGGLVSNATSVYITANSSVNVSITANTLTLTTALAANSGGTGKSSYTAGDLLYASASDTIGVVAVPGSAANGQVLQIVNNLPAYGTLDGGTF